MWRLAPRLIDNKNNMSNIKLTLTHQGAEALREYASALPIAVDDLREKTDILLNQFNNLEDELGVHKPDFNDMLTYIKKMQQSATNAIEVLVPKMLHTADKIDEYVAYDPLNRIYIDASKTLEYVPRQSYSPLSSFNLSRASYTTSEVAKLLGYYDDKKISVFYAKDANVTSKPLHVFSDPIRNPVTGEILRSVKGYYAKNEYGTEECIYAEFDDKQGNLYCYTKYNGKSIMAQIKDDNAFLYTDHDDVSQSSNTTFNGDIIGSGNIYKDLKKVEYKPIALSSVERTEQQIINSISGGDMTEGSCSSLALAYAGNKAGYIVYDFRDGKSRKAFSLRSNINQIANLANVNSSVIYGKDDAECAERLMSKMESGKEYYLATGRHAAVVRKNNDGHYQYLELQSQYKSDNGWQFLTQRALYERFACQSTHDTEWSNYLIDLASLQQSNEFLNLLGYINTDESVQAKGEEGHVR